MPEHPAQKMHNVVERVHEHPRRASATEDDHLMDHLLHSSETETCPRPIDSTSPAGNETTVKEDLDEAGHETAATATWQPKWLRSIALGSFAAIFVFFAAALPLLLWYSERHHGILAARQSFVYIWRFGPTAVLTIIAAFWARVALQAMRYMPWIALHSGSLTLDKSMATLDYTSMLLPTVLIQSISRKHHLLSLVTVTSMILMAQIALVPGLFSLAAVRVEHDAAIEILDSFDIETDFANISTIPKDSSAFYAATAIWDFDIAYPFGVNGLVAYQTFRSRGGESGASRGTAAEPLKAVVDGVFAGLQCLELKSYSSILGAKSFTYDMRPVYALDVELHFEGCDKVITVKQEYISVTGGLKPAQWQVDNSLSPDNFCSELPQKNRQFMYFAAQFGPSATNSSLPALKKAAALICAPSAWLSKVEVLDDGLSPNVTLLPNQKTTPIAANQWEMLRNAYAGSLNVDGYQWTGSIAGPVSLDELRWVNKNVTDPIWYENDVLLNSTTSLLQTIFPFLGHYMLRQESGIESVGKRISTVDRLVVNRWICLSVTALFAISAAAVFTTILCHGRSRRTSAWRRDPATLFGSMLFLHEHMELFDQLAVLAPAQASVEWSQCKHSPLVLRRLVRALSGIFIVGVIAGLVVTQRMSASFDGLASIDDEGYTHLIWTSVPAMTMLSISLYMASCNAAYRSLYTLWSTSVRPCSSEEMDFSLLDMVGVRALYRSIRLKCYAVTISQLITLACGLLTTFASVLFAGKRTLPRQEHVFFPQETWFGTPQHDMDMNTVVSRRESIGSLVMRQGEVSLNYPQNTYYDLIFPALGGMQDIDPSRTLSVNVTMPAAQLDSTCRKLSGDDYRVEVDVDEENTLFISQSATCPNGTIIEITYSLDHGRANSKGQVYLGQPVPSVDEVPDVQSYCGLTVNISDFSFTPLRNSTYLWGAYSNGTDLSDSISVYSCTYEWTEVTTKVHLIPIDGVLTIDPEIPPQPDQSTRKPWSHPFRIQYAAAYPETYFEGNVLADEFGVLMQPYGDFTFEDLANASKEEDILRALRRNTAFTRAQIANFENRFAINASSPTGPPPAEGLPAVQATITSMGDYRLVQDATATYFLIGILSAVVLFNLWGFLPAALRWCGLSKNWVVDMNVKGLAPNEFNSFAALGSLMRDSNAWSQLPQGAELLSKDEIHGMLSNLVFRLGWFREDLDQSEHFTIGVPGHGGFEFVDRKKSI
ncbi:hypothetical protein CcaCcLH18_10963 [Colletotrichum camelliae]|nr:hypothetical protein CcaCcLH18_10963 [Colletotrichum camelliae]